MSDNLQTYRTHPAAEIFPLLPPHEVAELAADIAQNGLQEDIVMCGGKILDGRHRLLACARAGVEPRFAELPPGASPADFVWSRNFPRRQLSNPERLAAANMMARMKAKENKDRMTRGGSLVVLQGVKGTAQPVEGRSSEDALTNANVNAAPPSIISPDETMVHGPADMESPRASCEDYTDAMVAEGQRLLDEERTSIARAKESTLGALLNAYRFGRLVMEDVLGGSRGKRHKKTLLRYLRDVGYLPPTAEAVPTSVNNYKYIYRGAGTEANVLTLGLNREYYIVLGQTVRGDDLISAGLVHHLRHNPVMTHGEPDVQKLKETADMIRSSRKALKWNPKLTDMERTRGRPCDWGRLHSLPIGGLHDCLLHGLKDLPDRETVQDTIFEMIRLEGALCEATGQDFRGFLSKGGHMPDRRFRPPSAAIASPKALSRRLDRQRRIHRISMSASQGEHEVEAETEAVERIFHGDARIVLASGAVCPPGSIDIVVTDPPYSRQYYSSYRPENEVAHDMEETPEAEAELVAEVADVLLSNGLHRPEGFAWVQFCPMALVHQFVPPLLDVFRRHVGHYDYQLAIWDKVMTPKVSGVTHFTPQCEGVIIVSLGRPLNDVDEAGKLVQMHSPIFSCRPTKGQDDLFWKPVSLLKRIIQLLTYGTEGSREATSQIVLDPFGGAGSTAVAAIEMGRDYRLIESHAGQFDLAKAEVRAALASRRPAPLASSPPKG